MSKKLVFFLLLLKFFYVQPALGETLQYNLNFHTNTTPLAYMNCHPHEEKRREVITKYNLPKNVEWKIGATQNEWGDWKEDFCYLEYANNIYIYRAFTRFWQKEKPIEIVPLRQ